MGTSGGSSEGVGRRFRGIQRNHESFVVDVEDFRRRVDWGFGRGPDAVEFHEGSRGGGFELLDGCFGSGEHPSKCGHGAISR